MSETASLWVLMAVCFVASFAWGFLARRSGVPWWASHAGALAIAAVLLIGILTR